ncbi:hypothetical protein [Puia dinghuensis]|uniref:Uncharacterized protein n=1 Tax=Puia dinghuensis TaxID=1792502 RepID=A0A8J2UAA0_9BACT|nr:hypothetical protein [Puia dinghuensis]GGA89155.1 hypothetical protein GCM10011511_10480 [Puia dinghuensis]
MSVLVVEKLIEKVSTALQEMSDLNLLVRRLPPSQELLNKLHERVESVQTAVGEMEKVVQKNTGQLDGLEEQVKLLPAGIESLKTAAESLEGELRKFAAKESVLPMVIDGLKFRMDSHEQALKHPAVQQVKHHHHTHWSIAAAVVLLLVCIVLCVFLGRSWSRIDLEKGRDFKYRYLEELNNTGLEKLLHQVDSAYIADPDKFEKATEGEEERQRQEWEAARQLENDKEGLRESQEKVKASQDEFRKTQRRGKGGE